MKFTIEIGMEAVVNEVYALAALRYVNATGEGEERPALLTRGHEELIERAVSDQFALLSAELSGGIADVDMDALGMSIECGVAPAPGVMTALRRGMERVLALRVMASAVAEADAARYDAEAEGALLSLRVVMAGSIPRRAQCWV